MANAVCRLSAICILDLCAGRWGRSKTADTFSYCRSPWSNSIAFLLVWHSLDSHEKKKVRFTEYGVCDGFLFFYFRFRSLARAPWTVCGNKIKNNHRILWREKKKTFFTSLVLTSGSTICAGRDIQKNVSVKFKELRIMEKSAHKKRAGSLLAWLSPRHSAYRPIKGEKERLKAVKSGIGNEDAKQKRNKRKMRRKIRKEFN